MGHYVANPTTSGRGHTCDVRVCLCSGLCRFSPFHSLSVSSESSNCDFHCDASVKPAQNNIQLYQHCHFIVLQICIHFITHFLPSHIITVMTPVHIWEFISSYLGLITSYPEVFHCSPQAMHESTLKCLNLSHFLLNSCITIIWFHYTNMIYTVNSDFLQKLRNSHFNAS